MKSAIDLVGLEYDWLGTDSVGNVALFSTAGGGYAPDAFLQDTEAHDVALARLLDCPATTSARSYPTVSPGRPNPWRLAAERGLYAFDADANGGPYRLVAAPQTAALIKDLPVSIAEVARRVTLTGESFATLTKISGAMLRSMLDAK